jgi:cyclophilin family peptidyl-prolyl cis-trans isomerase
MLQLKNKFPILLFIFLGLLFYSHHAISQNIFKVKTNRKIWEAKDRNDAIYTKTILKSGTNNQKILALKGLQSWQDSSLRKPLLRLVKKGNTAVKIAALETIGQTRDSFYIPYLLKIVNHKKKQKIKPVALVALGKCITKSKVDKLVTINNTNQYGYAECIYRAMLKGVGHPDLTIKTVNLLLEDDYDNKFYSAWYLARTNFTLSQDKFFIVFDLLKSSRLSSDIAIPLLIALGKNAIGSYSSAKQTIFDQYLSIKDDDLRDESGLNVISVYRANLKEFSFDSSNCKLVRSTSGISNPAVQLAYSELISKNCNAFEKNPKLTYSPAIVNLLKANECKYNNLKLPVTHTIYDKIWYLQVLENDYNFYPSINTILMQTEEPAIKSAATESLIKCRNSKGFPDNLMSDFNETITLLIKDSDEGALSIIANAILEKQIPIESNYRELFEEAQAKLKLPQEMEAYIDISKVLAMIDKTAYKKPLPEWNHPIDWDYVSKIREDQKIKVTTNQGEFIIQMNVNEAPGSVASILKLVEDGFYNGKYFHRMVPNFVVQGGCPRGDGFGGVNYTIRSEFSSLKYSTGAVGLASSGPDTESCQWFVTHCPTPHLDGRYTIIGNVIKGMETIHKLGVGDKMIKVEIL